MLNIIWSGFFLIAFLVALIQLLLGQPEVFNQMMQASFDMSKLAFEIALGLTGVLCFWMGIMKVGEKAGFIQVLTRFLTPLFARLMPEVPKDHPALGSITMNMAANVLGLDNAATPMGLKAMQDLQTLNPQKDTASNAQIFFLVINTSSVTLLPVTIFTYRAQQGAANPTDVFIPILIATYVSTLVGFLSVAYVQRINLLDRVILAYLAGITAIIGGLLLYFSQLPSEVVNQQSALISSFFIFTIIVVFILAALIQRINVYEAFIEGAVGGFEVAVKIIPYLVAMLVAIGIFRASGALNLLVETVRSGFALLSIDTRFVDALPTAFMKPLSGSGARAMMIEAMQTHGADSFVGRLVCVIQGSTETTFYILAVYFGSVGIQKIRHALACGLLADLGGIIAAIAVCYLFFG